MCHMGRPHNILSVSVCFCLSLHTPSRFPLLLLPCMGPASVRHFRPLGPSAAGDSDLERSLGQRV